MATHKTEVAVRTPAQKAGTSFWSMTIRWEEIWKARWWIVSSLILFHALGLSVNHGPSMNYLGWVYATKWFSLPEKDGQIFRFASVDLPAWCKYLPWCTQVKRRVGETPDGRIIFKGDNSEWSKDRRDGLKPVPRDHIAGVVYAAISPRRAAGWFTANGRWRNRVELRYSPIRLHWNRDKCAVSNPEGGFSVIYPSGAEVFFTGCDFWAWSRERKLQVMVTSRPRGYKGPPQIDIYEKNQGGWTWVADASPYG